MHGNVTVLRSLKYIFISVFYSFTDAASSPRPTPPPLHEPEGRPVAQNVATRRRSGHLYATRRYETDNEDLLLSVLLEMSFI